MRLKLFSRLLPLVLLLSLLAPFATPAHAAFRFVESPKKEYPANGTHTHLRRETREYHPLTRLFHPFRSHTSRDDRYNKVADGLFAFICAMFGIVSFAVLGLTTFELFLIPAFILGILATIFGSAGVTRHKKAYAILGLTLGFLEIIAAIVVVALL